MTASGRAVFSTVGRASAAISAYDATIYLSAAIACQQTGN